MSYLRRNRPKPKGRERSETTEKQLQRIADITRNARATWIGLLGVLVFCGVTLLGVEDIDFFALDNLTLLPFLNVAIPIESFFIFGALLVTAIYIYHHIYLELLWKELGTAPAQVDGQPLNKVVTPWLINEWALRERNSLVCEIARKAGAPEPDACIEPRTFGWVGTLMSTTMVWGFAPLVVGLFWWGSAPAHYDWLTGLIGLFLVLMLITAWYSGRSALLLLAGRTKDPKADWFSTSNLAAMACFLVLGFAVTFFSLARTASDWVPGMHPLQRADLMASGIEKAEWINLWQQRDKTQYWDNRAESVSNAGEQWALATDRFYMNFGWPLIRSADLQEAFLTQLPPDWLNRAEAEKEFRARWANREGLDYANPFVATDARKNPEQEFQTAWRESRETYLSVQQKPILEGRNLRNANLANAFLPGVDLGAAQMEGANLRLAKMEGADLSDAQMEGADLRSAQMERADLFGAQMEGADLFGAQMEGAVLSDAQMEGANLRLAQMEAADLSGAQMEGADLSEAQMEGADLTLAQMEGANLSFAQMEGAGLLGAQMERANLFGARLHGEGKDKLNLADAATLKSASIPLAGMRVADLSGVDVTELDGWNETFGDASVILPEGVERPPKWCSSVLDNAEYFGRWRGLIDAANKSFLNDLFDNHPPIPPSPC